MSRRGERVELTVWGLSLMVALGFLIAIALFGGGCTTDGGDDDAATAIANCKPPRHLVCTPAWCNCETGWGLQPDGGADQ